MILPLYASLEKLDLSLLEASADLGARAHSTFWRVTVPMTMPGIVAGIILVFVPSLGQFIVSDLLGGAKTILAGNLIQNQFAVARNKPFGVGDRLRADGRGAAAALRLRAVHEAQGPGGAAVKRGWVLRAHTWLVYLFLYAPIAILVLFSFNRTSQTAVWQGFTLDWYRSLLARRAHPRVGPEQPVVGARHDRRRDGRRHARGPRARPLRVPRARRSRRTSCTCRSSFPRS